MAHSRHRVAAPAIAATVATTAPLAVAAPAASLEPQRVTSFDTSAAGTGARALTGVVVDFGARPRCSRYQIEVSIDGHDWVPVADRATGAQRVQRAEFTGLGRYLRLTAHGCRAPLRLAEVTVLGTR